MRERTRIIRQSLVALTGALVLGVGSNAHAQTASTTYKGTRQDPFSKYKPPVRRKVEKKAPEVVTVPPIQTRIENYKARRQAAMNLRQPAPKPTTALLLNEVQVTGIFRTPRGYAAMVEATPIKLSYVIYPGEAFYDGMLVAIEETKLVFRRETRWTDGRRNMVVEVKDLRQANAVADSLTAQKTEGQAPPATGAAATGPAAAASSDANGKDASNSKDVEALSSIMDKLLVLLKKQ